LADTLASRGRQHRPPGLSGSPDQCDILVHGAPSNHREIFMIIWSNARPSTTGSLTANFNSNGGYLTFWFTGSAWCNAAPALIGAHLEVDKTIVATASVFTNEGNSHRALVPTVTSSASIKAGTHVLAIAPSTSPTKIDNNDVFTLVITES
jgi:hypothetical protein